MKRIYLILFFLSLSFRALSANCERPQVLLQKFIPIKLQERSTVGQEQLESVKSEILNFLSANPKLIINEILVVSTAPKFPMSKGKTSSDFEYTLSLISQRAVFLKKMLSDIKKQNPKINHFKTFAEIAGPEYVKKDLNLRFVTPETPSYDSQLENMYNKNEQDYNQKALVRSVSELKAQKNGNLYLDKFRPFLGFRLEIFGCSPNDSKEMMLSPKVIKQ